MNQQPKPVDTISKRPPQKKKWDIFSTLFTILSVIGLAIYGAIIAPTLLQYGFTNEAWQEIIISTIVLGEFLLLCLPFIVAVECIVLFIIALIYSFVSLIVEIIGLTKRPSGDMILAMSAKKDQHDLGHIVYVPVRNSTYDIPLLPAIKD